VLCISPVFRDQFFGEIKLFLRRERWKTPAPAAGHCTYGETLTFAFPQQTVTTETYKNIMHRNMVLRQFLQIPTKCRFTKYFSLFSTESGDNFVENDSTIQLLPMDKPYTRLNVDKNGIKIAFKNQSLRYMLTACLQVLPHISAAEIFVHKSVHTNRRQP